MISRSVTADCAFAASSSATMKTLRTSPSANVTPVSAVVSSMVTSYDCVASATATVPFALTLTLGDPYVDVWPWSSETVGASGFAPATT